MEDDLFAAPAWEPHLRCRWHISLENTLQLLSFGGPRYHYSAEVRLDQLHQAIQSDLRLKEPIISQVVFREGFGVADGWRNLTENQWTQACQKFKECLEECFADRCFADHATRKLIIKADQLQDSRWARLLLYISPLFSSLVLHSSLGRRELPLTVQQIGLSFPHVRTLEIERLSFDTSVHVLAESLMQLSCLTTFLIDGDRMGGDCTESREAWKPLIAAISNHETLEEVQIRQMDETAVYVDEAVQYAIRLNRAKRQCSLSADTTQPMEPWFQALISVRDREDCLDHLLSKDFNDPSLYAIPVVAAAKKARLKQLVQEIKILREQLNLQDGGAVLTRCDTARTLLNHLLEWVECLDCVLSDEQVDPTLYVAAFTVSEKARLKQLINDSNNLCSTRKELNLHEESFETHCDTVQTECDTTQSRCDNTIQFQRAMVRSLLNQLVNAVQTEHEMAKKAEHIVAQDERALMNRLLDAVLAQHNTVLTQHNTVLNQHNMVQTLHEELSGSNDTVKILQDKLSGSNDMVKTLEEELSCSNDLVKTLEEELFRSNNVVQTLQEKQARIEKANNDLKQHDQKQCEKVDKLQKEIQDWKERAGTHCNDMEHWKERDQTQCNAIKKLEKEIQDWKERDEAHRNAIKELETAIQDWKERDEGHRAKLEELEKDGKERDEAHSMELEQLRNSMNDGKDCGQTTNRSTVLTFLLSAFVLLLAFLLPLVQCDRSEKGYYCISRPN